LYYPPQKKKKSKKKILNAFKKEEKDYHTQTMANFVIYVFQKKINIGN
jgi:hypothetical protein